MRGDLEKLPGVSDIKTDHKATTASFKIADEKLADQKALKAKLDEFAKTNKHMKDWSFIDDGLGGTDGKGGKSKKKEGEQA